jgi:hypothetical protein
VQGKALRDEFTADCASIAEDCSISPRCAARYATELRLDMNGRPTQSG